MAFSINKSAVTPERFEETFRCEGGLPPYPFIIAFTPPNTQNP